MAETESRVVITAEDKTQAAFRSVQRSLGSVQGAISSLLPALSALGGVGGFAAMIKQQVDLGDQLNKTSQKIGVSVEALSRYQYAAKLSDVSNETLTASLAKLGKNVAEAVGDPTSKAAQALRNLGFTAEELKNQRLETIFEQVAPKLAGIQNEAVRVQYQMQLLGKSGYEIAPLLNSLGELTAEAERAGQTISTDFAKKAEELNDHFTRLEAGTGKLARAMAGLLVPALSEAIERFNTLVGIQDSLSLDLLQKDRAALALEYSLLAQRGEQQSARAQALIRQIDEVDTKIIAANRKILAARELKEAAPAAVQPAALGKAEPEEKSRGGAKFGPDLEKEFNAYQMHLDAMSAARDRFDEAMTTRNADQLLRVQEQYLMDNELLVLQYEAQQFIIDEAYANQLLSYSERAALMERMELEHQARLGNIFAQGELARRKTAQMSWQQQAGLAAQALGGMATLMQTNSKRQFEIGKKAAIAETVINTGLAAMKAYQSLSGIPYVGPILGAVAAAAAIAYGVSQVQKIKATQFGGGASAGGGAPAVPTYSANPSTGLPEQPFENFPGQTPANAGQSRIINVTLTGSRYSADEVRELIDVINEQQADGVRVQ